MAPTEALTIGGLASAAGVNIETIRYYERRGLLSPAGRTDAGYRQFDAGDVWRLAFIRRAKDLGFTLAEIGDLLGADGSVLDVLAAAQAKLVAVDGQIEQLRHQRQQLTQLVATCQTGDAGECLDLSAN
jgi:DNA-binding transcriptional MerR regulator